MFEEGNVVRFKEGPQKFNMWGDRVELEHFLVGNVAELDDPGYVPVYAHPYRLVLHEDELELVSEDEFSEFPDDFMKGWLWWDSLDDEDKDDYTGPNWLEYLGR